MRRAFAAAVAIVVSGSTTSLLAQEQMVDPSTAQNPFADGGAPLPDAASPDPTLGPDPFTDGGAAPSTPTPTPSADAPSSAATSPATAVAPSASPPVATSLPPLRREDEDAERDALTFGNRHATVTLTLLVQPQLVWEWFNAAASPNLGADGALPAGVGANATLGQPDGTTTNRGTFRLRRARIGLELSTRTPIGAAFEIDPNLADRANPASESIARRFELLVRSTPVAFRDRTEPRYELGAGLFRVPFSRDLAEPHAERIFVERATGTRAMFPEDADLGVRLRRVVPQANLSFDVAVVNGVTVGEPAFGRSPDLNKTKDVTARITVKQSTFEAGLGGYAGQSQAVDTTSLRVQQRSRAALALDALFRIRVTPTAPETRVLGEVVVGRNMDRGVLYPFVNRLPADQTQGLPNFDSRSAWIRIEQDFGRVATLGFRYDAYTPDATLDDNSRHTFAVAFARSFGRHLRLALEIDHTIDRAHPQDIAPRTKLVEVASLLGTLRY